MLLSGSPEYFNSCTSFVAFINAYNISEVDFLKSPKLIKMLCHKTELVINYNVTCNRRGFDVLLTHLPSQEKPVWERAFVTVLRDDTHIRLRNEFLCLLGRKHFSAVEGRHVTGGWGGFIARLCMCAKHGVNSFHASPTLYIFYSFNVISAIKRN